MKRIWIEAREVIVFAFASLGFLELLGTYSIGPF